MLCFICCNYQDEYFVKSQYMLIYIIEMPNDLVAGFFRFFTKYY